MERQQNNPACTNVRARKIRMYRATSPPGAEFLRQPVHAIEKRACLWLILDQN